MPAELPRAEAPFSELSGKSPIVAPCCRAPAGRVRQWPSGLRRPTTSWRLINVALAATLAGAGVAAYLVTRKQEGRTGPGDDRYGPAGLRALDRFRQRQRAGGENDLAQLLRQRYARRRLREVGSARPQGAGACEARRLQPGGLRSHRSGEPGLCRGESGDSRAAADSSGEPAERHCRQAGADVDQEPGGGAAQHNGRGETEPDVAQEGSARHDRDGRPGPESTDEGPPRHDRHGQSGHQDAPEGRHAGPGRTEAGSDGGGQECEFPPASGRRGKGPVARGAGGSRPKPGHAPTRHRPGECATRA